MNKVSTCPECGSQNIDEWVQQGAPIGGDICSDCDFYSEDAFPLEEKKK